jgi:FkbM family methyltransferase
MSNENAALLRRRLGWVNQIRPGILGAFIAGLLAPDRRTIVNVETGAELFVDPLSQLGGSILDTGRYESETEVILRKYLCRGAYFLDIGANEGYFSVLAGSIVGPEGYVASVEPQSRLYELIKINMGLNGMKANVFWGALGGEKGETGTLYLSPALNTGYSNLLSPARFSRRSETIRFIDPADLILDGRPFTLAKVDVEGFESEVVDSLLPMLRDGMICALVLDYHATVLAGRGIFSENIERRILDAGMSLQGDPVGYSGYRIYVKG